MLSVLYYSDSKTLGGAEMFFKNLASNMPNDKISVTLVKRDGFFRHFVLLKKILDIKPDIVHLNFPVPFSNLLSIIVARFAGARVIIGSIYSVQILSSRYPFVKHIKKFLSMLILKNVNYFVTDSAFSSKLLIKNYKISKDKVSVVYYGFEPSVINAALISKPKSKGNIDIGIVSRLVKDKGHSMLIDVFSGIAANRNDVRLFIIGDGPIRETLEKQARATSFSDRVLFTGFVTNEKKFEYFRMLDLFVLPSFYESMPLSVLEAMLFSSPIITTCVGGIPEIVRSDMGVLIQPNSKMQLHDAINDFIMDRARYEKMAATAKEYVSNFKVSVLVDAYLDIYRRSVEKCYNVQ